MPSADLVIKVWSVFFQKTDTNGFAEDSSSVQIKLGYHSSISLTHMTSVSSVAAFCQPSGKIAIPYQGTITVKSYLEPSPHAQVAAISKEKMRKITHLARLAPFSLWATASIDKFVRIREDDGTLVRYITNSCKL